METPLSSKPLKLPRHIWPITLTACGLLLAIYIPVYYWEPFPEKLNANLLGALDLIASLTAAFFGTLFARQFAPGEPSRRVWLIFVLGWWAWVVAEVLWMVYHFFMDALPYFSGIDACWLAGYFLFGLSLYYGYRLISGKGTKQYTFFLIVAAILLLTTALTALWRRASLDKEIPWAIGFLSILYPVSDLAEGAFALRLSLLFGRGRLGRPWWGLISFAVADSINVFLWLGGVKIVSEQVSNLLSLFSVIFYVGAYLLAALGFLSILLLLQRQPPKAPALD